MRKPQDCTLPTPCRKCKAPMLWVEWSRSGKKSPVDSEPSPRGNIVLTLSGGTTGRLIAQTFNHTKHQGRNRYTSHFVTCPQAAAFRKGH